CCSEAGIIPKRLQPQETNQIGARQVPSSASTKVGSAANLKTGLVGGMGMNRLSPEAPATSGAATPAAAVPHHPLLGAATMLLALAMLPGMDAIAKHLAQDEHLPPLEITWGRFVFYLLAMAPLGLGLHGTGVFRPKRPLLQVTRGVLFGVSA